MTTPSRRGILIALVVLVSTLVVATSLRAPGSELDEGILLSFPTRVAAGDLPYRDFETFYGPGSPYLVAAAFAIAGPHLATERAVGLLSRVLLVLVIYLLVRRFGDLVAACCAGIALVLVGNSSVADSGIAADAFLLLALLLAATGRAREKDGRAWWLAAGLAAGAAALFRPEWTVAFVVAVIPLAWPHLRRLWSSALGLGFGLLPYVPLALAAGYPTLRENIDDLRATGTARRLPLPSPSTSSGRVLALVIVTLGALALAYALSRREQRTHTPLLLSLLAVGLLQLPYGFWRVDEGHVIAAGLVPLSLAPLSASIVLARRSSPAALGAVFLVLAALALPSGLRGDYARNLRLVTGRADPSKVSNGERSFVVDDRAAAADLQATVRYMERHATPGSRLFVGPRDLRRTNMNDAMLYYLLPQLEPATFYLEMDPPFSRPGSRLASDVASADHLVLTTRWDDWDEPNGSSRFGSDLASRVVSSGFCRAAAFGTYSVWQRCMR